MSEAKTYNGWTNYETWNVALWIDNDQGSQGRWREATQAALDDTDEDLPIEERREEAVYDLSERLKDEIREEMPALGASMWADLLNASLSEVDWRGIATSWLSELDVS